MSRGYAAIRARSGSGPVRDVGTGPEFTWITTGVPVSSSVPHTSRSNGSMTSMSPTWTCTLNTSVPASIRRATYSTAPGSG